MSSEWPKYLLNIGELRSRSAAKDSRCKYAGCKDVEVRAYVNDDKRIFTICFPHAIRWKEWQDAK